MAVIERAWSEPPSAPSTESTNSAGDLRSGRRPASAAPIRCHPDVAILMPGEEDEPLKLEGVEIERCRSTQQRFKELDFRRNYLLYCGKGVMVPPHAPSPTAQRGHTNVRVVVRQRPEACSAAASTTVLQTRPPLRPMPPFGAVGPERRPPAAAP